MQFGALNGAISIENSANQVRAGGKAPGSTGCSSVSPPSSGEASMGAYLVRTIDDHDIVGFVFADDMDDLLTDECTEPDDCEYVELPHARH
jgi:hypothetical protein